MATREIKTTIALDGEQKFKQALSAATREMRVMESELKAVSAAYDVNGQSAQYYAAKQSNLRGQIDQQRQIIKALELAIEDSAKAYGETSSQVDGYAIRLNNARARMSRLEKELEATDREVEELGRDSVRAGRQLEQGIGEGAEEAEKDVRSLIQTMKEDLSSIRTSTTFTAVGSLWNMAKDAYSSASGFVEQTAEYRRQLSFLEQNASTSGFDFSEVKKQLIEVQTFTGEATSAVEGLSNLLAIDMDDRQMESAINNLAGAVISFPETLKFESLADGLQETIATGAATGAFAELLERLGVDVEDFNTALENSETQAGDVEIALAYLAEHGLADVYKQWQLNNQELTEAQRTQAELDMELAEFGGHLENYIVTPVKELLVDALGWVNDTIEKEKKKYEELGKEAYNEDVQNRIVDALKSDVSAGSRGAVSTLGSSAEVNAQIVKNNLSMRNALIEAGKKIWDQLEWDMKYSGGITYDSAIGPPTAFQNSAIEWMRRTYANGKYFLPNDQWKTAAFNLATDAQMSALEAVNNIYKRIEENARSEGENAASAYLDGWDSITLNADEAREAEGIQSKMKKAGTSNWQEVLKEIESMAPELKESSEDAGDAAVEGFETGVSSMPANAYRNGAEAIEQLAAGMRSRISYVAMAAAQAAAAAAGGTRGVGTAVSGAAAAVNAVLSIDGTEFARITAPYMSAQLAVQ